MQLVSSRRTSAGRPRRQAPPRGVRTCLVAAIVSCLMAPALSSQDAPVADTTALARLRAGVIAVSPTLAARRAELAAAQAHARGAGAAPHAVLSAEVEEVPGGLDIADAGSLRLELSREVLTSGRRGIRRQVAEAEVAEASARLQMSERAVQARVDRLLVRALGSTAVSGRLGSEDSLLAEVEEALRGRFAVGEARYVDVLRLRTERLRARADLAAALGDARVSRHALVALVGASEEAASVRQLADSMLAASPAAFLDGAVPPAPELDSLIALSGSARLAGATLARAEATAALRRASLRPALSAGLGVQRFEKGQGHRIGPTLSLAVSLPFTGRGANRAIREAADRSAEAARRQHQATFAATLADIRAARDRYETARERLAVFGAALLRGAREERESALGAYRTGDLSLLELLDFERALARAEITRLRARIEAADAYADLIAGSAGDIDDSFQPVSPREEGAE